MAKLTVVSVGLAASACFASTGWFLLESRNQEPAKASVRREVASTRTALPRAVGYPTVRESPRPEPFHPNVAISAETGRPITDAHSLPVAKASGQRFVDSSSRPTQVMERPHSLPVSDVPTSIAPLRSRRIIIEPRLPVFLAGAPQISFAAPIPGLELELGAEVRQPVALMEPEEELTPSQAKALARISDDFVDRVEEAATTRPAEELGDVWDAEQSEADSQYRILFGDQAFNRKQMDAAIEAMGLPVK